MALNPFKEKGTPIEKQIRTWTQMVQHPYPKQEVDAFTRCRVILMNGIENEATGFSHAFARQCTDRDLKGWLAAVRRVEHQQQVTVNWLNPSDQSVLETTIAYEQVAIELTAYLARMEPDPYVKQAFDFGLLEDFDHLYRYAQLLDLIHGKVPDEILQGKTDVIPGRPTQDHHNDPFLRLLEHYRKDQANPISKVHVLTLMAGEQQTLNFYKNFGPMYGSELARRLYAEISEVEEEHVTQYESLMDPNETWLERWVMHEFTECTNYNTCMSTETDPRIKRIWEEFLSQEIEHLRVAGEMLKRYEKRDPEELCGGTLPTPATFQENRDYIRDVLLRTADLRLVEGGQWKKASELPENWRSYGYQRAVNADGAPSEAVVRVRMEAGGEEVVRARDEDLARRAGELRTRTLDAEKAPDTAPEAPPERAAAAKRLARKRA